MRYVGIDPGASGGIAVLDEDGSVLRAIKMPETERDVLETLLPSGPTDFDPRPCRAVLERVWSSPQMGVSSSFKFGVGVGSLRMALTAAAIPFSEVTPQRWQKAMGCQAGKSRANGGDGGDKNVTKRRAQQLFPNVKVTHAIADALLIADYCRRVERGLLPQPIAEPKRQARRAKTELF